MVCDIGAGAGVDFIWEQKNSSGINSDKYYPYYTIHLPRFEINQNPIDGTGCYPLT